MKKTLTLVFIFASLFASSQELMNKNFEGFRLKVSELVINGDTVKLNSGGGLNAFQLLTDTTAYDATKEDLSILFFRIQDSINLKLSKIDTTNKWQPIGVGFEPSYASDSSYILSAVRAFNKDRENKSTYHITLPSASSVAGRIALATDYPAGWTLTANGVNLVVTHNLGRWCTDVKVFSIINGTQRQQLRLSAAENGLTALSANQAEVYSLATIAKDIVLYLYFE